MKRFALVPIFLTAFGVMVLLGSQRASADTVTLTLTGTGGATAGNDYIYPYYFTISGDGKTTKNVALMCISFDKEISVGEHWTADVFTAGSLGRKYEEAAYLLSLADSPGSSAKTISDAQWAAWYLFYPAAGKKDPGTGDDISNFIPSNLNPDLYANYLIYVPEAGTQSGNLGLAQTFVGVSPEPGSLVLLGSGILGLAMLMYFTKHRHAGNDSAQMSDIGPAN